MLNLHLNHQALHGADGGIATLHTHTGHRLGPVTIEQVQDWCATPDAHITLKPVLDLSETLTCPGYRPTARLHDHVIALNPTCVFPHCHRPADNLDLDHIKPHAEGDATTTGNLAPLCRRHHRAKTHADWTYLQLAPANTSGPAPTATNGSPTPTAPTN